MPDAIRHTTLDNGLTIVAEPDPAAHSASIGLFVKTGARDEPEPLMGVSHFLEHMMFKGSARRSADDVNREFDEIGAAYNAYTSHELTCYYATTLPEFFPKAAELVADLLRPALRQEDFDAEKGVILEEIAMYQDSPFWRLYEEVAQRRYPGHGLGFRVLGTTETITALSRDQMQAYYESRYGPDNTVAAVAGAVEFSRAVDLLAELTAEWPPRGARRRDLEAPVGQGALTLRDERVHRAYSLLMAPAPSAQDERRYAAALLGQILGGSDNARLRWALIEPGLAEEAHASFEPHDHAGDFVVYTACDPERAEEVWAIALREIERLGPSLNEEDLQLLKPRMATAVAQAGEKPSGTMQRLGRQWTQLGTALTLEEELARINAVTLEDLRACLEAFPFTPRVEGRLSPAPAPTASA